MLTNAGRHVNLPRTHRAQVAWLPRTTLKSGERLQGNRMGKVVLPAMYVDDFVSGQDDKFGRHSVASGTAYLVETDCFDSQDGPEARYKRGVPNAFLCGHVSA